MQSWRTLGYFPYFLHSMDSRYKSFRHTDDCGDEPYDTGRTEQLTMYQLCRCDNMIPKRLSKMCHKRLGWVL